MIQFFGSGSFWGTFVCLPSILCCFPSSYQSLYELSLQSCKAFCYKIGHAKRLMCELPALKARDFLLECELCQVSNNYKLIPLLSSDLLHLYSKLSLRSLPVPWQCGMSSTVKAFCSWEFCLQQDYKVIEWAENIWPKIWNAISLSNYMYLTNSFSSAWQ